MRDAESLSDASENDIARLTALLEGSGVDTTSWGSGEFKTVAHLAAELRAGDCELIAESTGLVRRVRNVWVDVFSTVDGATVHLVERRQVFIDGRERARVLPASLGEKCKIGEDPAVAARRALREELGVDDAAVVQPGVPRTNPAGRHSYPTLRTVYDTSWFVAILDRSQHRPEGYVEIQPDKRTYFAWESWPSDTSSSIVGSR